MKNINSTGLARQDAFVQSMIGQDFDFGLVMTQAFLKGIRDIGYKSTATALFESFDNSIQAGAENIHLIFDFDKGKPAGAKPDRIAIVDDGHGMSKEMIRVAVLWGGSDRIDDRQGMGKYGYGLPSSCVSIGERFTVLSKREDMSAWHAVTIDIKEIASRSPEYIDVNTGRVLAPEAKVSKVPEFVLKHLKQKFNSHHGTIIIIDKIDRLSKQTFSPLKKFLSQETGITFRNYLRSINIFIDGDSVEPIDPLFTTEGYRLFDENDFRAEALPPLEIKANNSANSKVGSIKVRYAYFPVGFFAKNPTQEELNKDDDETEEESKRKNKRFSIKKQNKGIIFMRNGRQVDVVDSKIPWTIIRNNDSYWGVEIDFSAELDEEFSITTSKQQIVVSERIWNILRDNGVYEAIQQMRKRYGKDEVDHDIKKNNESNSDPEKRDQFAENLMKESARDFEEVEPPHIRKEADENFKKQTKKIAKETGIPENVVKQQLESQTETRPFKLDYFDELEGPFYRAEQIGGQVVIFINKAHKFHTELYNNPRTNAFTKNALAMLVFVLGHSELRVTDDKRKWYKQERNAWSMKLDATLENLSKYFSKNSDDGYSDEEQEMTDPPGNKKMKK